MSKQQTAEVIEAEVVEPGVMEVIARGEMQTAVDIAHRYPRSIERFQKDAMSMATVSEEVAAQCFYTLTRYDKKTGETKYIEGPSIRLAEICMQAYTNIKAGARIVREEDRFVIAQGVAHDLQKNSSISIEVRRRITGKTGHRYGDDMIGVTSNAAASIALRNAILKTIPAVLVGPIYQQCKKVAVGTEKTLAHRRAKMIEKFADLQVSVPMLLRKTGREAVDDMGLKDLEILIGVFNAIQGGDSTVPLQFPREAAPSPTAQALTDKIKAGQDKRAAPKPETPADEAPAPKAGESEPAPSDFKDNLDEPDPDLF